MVICFVSYIDDPCRMMYHRVGNRLEGDNVEAVKVMGLAVGVYVVKVGETGVKKVVVM